MEIQQSHFHFKGWAWDMIISPLHNDNVLASIPHNIVYLVVVATHMFDEHLFTWALGPIHPHIQNIVPCKQWTVSNSKQLLLLFSCCISLNSILLICSATNILYITNLKLFLEQAILIFYVLYVFYSIIILNYINLNRNRHFWYL